MSASAGPDSSRVWNSLRAQHGATSTCAPCITGDRQRSASHRMSAKPTRISRRSGPSSPAASTSEHRRDHGSSTALRLLTISFASRTRRPDPLPGWGRPLRVTDMGCLPWPTARRRPVPLRLAPCAHAEDARGRAYHAGERRGAHRGQRGRKTRRAGHRRRHLRGRRLLGVVSPGASWHGGSPASSS